MKVLIKGFIKFEKPWGSEHGFSFVGYDPTKYGEASVMGHSIEVDIPDNYDPRPDMVKGLEAMKEKARKEFADKVMQIDRQINELLALEHTS